MLFGSWKKHLLLLLTFCVTVLVLGAVRSQPVIAGPQPTPCLTDWQNHGDAVKVQLDETGCHAVLQFPNEGATQAVAFKIDPSFYDPKYPVQMVICKMVDGTTPGDGVSVSSPELSRNPILKLRREVQFGTISAGGKDCLRVNPKEPETIWLIQAIGAPSFPVSIDVSGIMPEEAQ